MSSPEDNVGYIAFYKCKKCKHSNKALFNGWGRWLCDMLNYYDLSEYCSQFEAKRITDAVKILRKRYGKPSRWERFKLWLNVEILALWRK